MVQAAVKKENPLGYEKVSKLLFRFALPSIIGMLVSALYNIVDQIFIGQGVGMLGNAATNVAFPITTICTALGLLLGLGGASGFNLELGAGEKEKAGHFIGNAITMLLVSGCVFCSIILFFLDPLLDLFGATAQVLPYARPYTQIIALGVPFLIFTNGASAMIRSDGNPTRSMTCMIIGAVINTILDPIFIFKFGWGMAGAAWATIIGQFASFLFAVRYLVGFQSVALHKAYFRPCFGVVKKMAALGAAASFNQVAMTLVQITMNNTLRHYGALSVYGSEIPLACVGVITKVNIILISFIIGTAQGMQPIIGFNYGAKQYDRVRAAFYCALRTTAVMSFIAFLCFQLLPRQIISIFGQGNALYYQFAERYFHIFLLMTFANGVQPVTSNLFTSIGKAYKGILVSLTRQILFLLPLILLFPLFMGIDGIIYAGPIADSAALLVSVFLVRNEMKQMRKLEQEPLTA